VSPFWSRVVWGAVLGWATTTLTWQVFGLPLWLVLLTAFIAGAAVL
jgi:hypothetical protein